MRHLSYLLLLLIIQIFKHVESRCSGGLWAIQNITIGSFTIAWRYNDTAKTVQFIVEGQVVPSINLTSTYIAIGWSDAETTMNNMDVAIFFPEVQLTQDRYIRESVIPILDSQQDFCVIQTNTTGQHVYVTFERMITTGDDDDDINFTSDLYLMFSMGSYAIVNDTNIFQLQQHFFRRLLTIRVNLMNCISIGCLTANCSTKSCLCLQDVISNVGQCTCFPSSSSCISNSKLPISTTAIPSISAITQGSCESQISSCSSNGICLQISSSHFLCQCNPDYTGVLCQTAIFSPDINILNACKCVNGGVCFVNGTCSCSDRYRGKLCQLDNPCNDYCQNNGLCTVVCTDTSCDTPKCTCLNGYSDNQCSTVITDACQSNPCGANGNCTKGIIDGQYECQCDIGYIGTRCDTIDSCSSNPCNQGSCVTSSNCLDNVCSYSCLCSNDTTGKNCEIDIDPCLSSPCVNGGRCLTSLNSYECQCVPPYGGTNCDLIVNVCIPNPCFNNGHCIRNLTIQDGEYRCECQTDYMGTRCEYFNGCSSSPCQNDGQCISSIVNCTSTTCPISCICSNGTTGVYCEQLDMSCLNGGTCLTNETTDISYCQCPANTTGSRCETIQIVCTNTTCSNNGVCSIDTSSDENRAYCVCDEGYTGENCQTSILPPTHCSRKPCGNDGTCIQTSVSSYYCICSNGLTGQSCNSTALISCASSPCRHLSTCQEIDSTNPPSYKCICPNYLTGDRCQYTNTCQKRPCLNQGNCIPLGPQNNFMCLCSPGFGHYDCSIYLGLSCNTSLCVNDGICDHNGTNIQCICPINFAGPRCEWNSVCSVNTCQNGGTCRQIAPTMAECLCQTGFTGPTCNLRDSCAISPCKNGGGCTTLLVDTGTDWSAYRCVCPPGIYGQNCDTAISSCSNMICPPYKICSEQATGPVCTCPANKVGTFCQYNNPCNQSSSICHNGGTCVSSNTDPPISSCHCREDYTGTYCEIVKEIDPCASNPCQTRGHCALSTLNKTFTCLCRESFIGERCERNNPCASSPCLNQALCQSYWNQTHTWFNCRCVGTYTGNRCETSLLNPCGGLCMNGSPCDNGKCVCPAQYTGTFCGFDNPCYQGICRNGGTCSVIANATNVSFTCTCSNSYTGQYCETSLDALANRGCLSECMNGGSCINSRCMCTSEYVGPLCQNENPCNHRNPCLNNGTCFSRYNTSGAPSAQCSCLQEFTGNSCEVMLCSPALCNGGICTPTQNSIACICPKGTYGDRCQYVDICATNPCAPNERCEQIENQYQCSSCYDKSSYCLRYQQHNEFCDNRYTIPIDNDLLPVPQACQRSCGKCIPVQRLKDISSLLHNSTSMEEAHRMSTVPIKKK
ncbi:unnamed protein product [Rotaria socialis]|uniref:Uncharacterized protein n=1 Tax=Rotaria socialis TaxID=392032 RepID=A0A821NLJ2_9BILA|nr:unnamed protein product [Rotaria socialis]